IRSRRFGTAAARPSGGGAEEEEAEAERVAAAELDVAPAAPTDPLEELPHAGLVGMLGGVALAVQAPRPLVAVEVVDARRHHVHGRQPEPLAEPDRARVVGQLLPRSAQRLEVLPRRLAAPVAVAVEDEPTRPHELRDRREL